MKRLATIALVLCSAGCSNAPIAGVMDWCVPTKPSGAQPPRPRDPISPDDRLPPGTVPPIGPPVGPAPKN